MARVTRSSAKAAAAGKDADKTLAAKVEPKTKKAPAKKDPPAKKAEKKAASPAKEAAAADGSKPIVTIEACKQ